MPNETENLEQQFAQRLMYKVKEMGLKGKELLGFFIGVMDCLDEGLDLETAITETEFMMITINMD